MSKFKTGDKVKIISCAKDFYWYADKIGEIYTIQNYSPDTRCYIMVEKALATREEDLALVNDQSTDDLKNILKNGARVKCRNGEMFTLIDGVFVCPSPKSCTGMGWLCTVDDFLEDQDIVGDEWDIVEIYDKPSHSYNYFAYDYHPTKLLWKREEKSPQQLELEKLQEQVRNLSDRIKMLQESTE